MITYLNRQGFNTVAVRPAAKAFLQTMKYMEELGASDSHSPETPTAQQSEEPSGRNGQVVFGGAVVGDLIQWESGGVLCLERPLRVRHVTSDGKWVAVDGSETGIPMEQVIVEERGQATTDAPRFPMRTNGWDEQREGQENGTDLRFKLGKGIVVQIRSKEELGPDELDRLLKLITAQKEALKDALEDASAE